MSFVILVVCLVDLMVLDFKKKRMLMIGLLVNFFVVLVLRIKRSAKALVLSVIVSFFFLFKFFKFLMFGNLDGNLVMLDDFLFLDMI